MPPNLATATQPTPLAPATGADLTGRAREYVRTGQWRQGLQHLKRAGGRLPERHALELLQGAKKLTGAFPFKLEADDAQEQVHAWVAEHFAFCFDYKGCIFRPYGYISAFNRADMRLAQSIDRDGDPELDENRFWVPASRDLGHKIQPSSYDNWLGFRNRPAYYAREREHDICFVQELKGRGDQAILCERLGWDVPPWHALPQDATQTANLAFEAGRLVDRYRELNPAYPSTDARAPAPPCEVPVQPPPSPEEEARHAALALAQVERLRLQIVAETDADAEHGWLERSHYDLVAGRNVTVRVPRRALICAALARAHARHLMPAYVPRCPPDLKMEHDDVFHSDAWVGAGFAVKDAYDQTIPEQRLFMDELYRIQRETLKFPFDVLARGAKPQVSGTVIHDPALAGPDRILVVRQAAPCYAQAALRCAAVIVESGSQLAHLAVVSRETGIPVLRVDNALHRFPAGRTLTLDLPGGTLRLPSNLGL